MANISYHVPVAEWLFRNTQSSWLWLIVRLYVGWVWLSAGWGKFNNPAWVGSEAGNAMSGFVEGALAKAGGAHPAVQGWYAAFLEVCVQPYPELWAHLITYGEMLVGAALILGVLAGAAAFFGIFMNLNFLSAGTTSTNPQLLVLGLFLLLAWRVAGWWGIDRYLLPKLGWLKRPQST
ncbi:MAG: DoxX family protein [Candidatus Vogelbacteria bacterium CG10_big_fil_rev_8_21_14_0_10_51_16]|uniref:DoxX family protein n=1 Tax=Candidatus Vogelbacteria bacterium CG10_big_fil_rev_8_21_14_0_10_51_16 TaxID=1975045 RepID=A0A2H0RHB5_9BACT|nr:MAG: DoxX family protein [Candidatus Vogelbacteria bacterium CG10_big_fil_rev_8_21_14_0_10_51_16]